LIPLANQEPASLTRVHKSSPRGAVVTGMARRMMVWLLPVLVIIVRPVVARAEADAAARALAVQLFDEAQSLFVDGKFAEACPKYAESYRLDPQLGALIRLGDCYEKNKQLASAWGSFRDAEEMARKRGDARAEMAGERAKNLQPRLSYLTIQVPQAVVVPGLNVTRDGAPVPKVLWGARAAVDAGTYRIAANAPGYATWQNEIAVGDDAVTAQVVVPKLVRVLTPTEPSSRAANPRTDSGTPRRIAAIAVGGLGLASIATGGFLGLSAQASMSDSKTQCNEQNYCTSRGATLRQSAKSKALVATVVTGVGVAAIATAAVLWFTAPRSERPESSATASRSSSWVVVPTDNSWGIGAQHAF